MPDYTDEEYDALDEYYTRNDIMPDLTKPGHFSRKYGMMVRLDPETTRIITANAQSTRRTPEEIIHALVVQELAVVTQIVPGAT